MTTSLKPWEEEWDVALPAATVVAWDGDRPKCGVAVPWRTLGPSDPTEDDIARMRLASAAPDMARVLLAIEWSGCDPTVSESTCPACGEAQAGGIHAPDCALAAALRKAGVR